MRKYTKAKKYEKKRKRWGWEEESGRKKEETRTEEGISWYNVNVQR